MESIDGYCRVRIHPKREIGTLGELAGEVGVDLAAVAICDVDRLAGWAQGDEDQWRRWGHQLWYGRATQLASMHASLPRLSSPLSTAVLETGPIRSIT